MTTESLHHQEHHPDSSSKVVFGFWIFILTNFISFATLFATYGVLHNNTYGGIGADQVVRLPYALIQSLIFLTSSFTYGLGIISLKQGNICKLRFWLVITFILGALFIGLELQEFSRILATGSSWQTSAFLSSFFTLVGFHTVNVIVGLLWMAILIVQLALQGASSTMKTRFACLGLYWDYLNVVWIFIFTIVYLMGAIEHV